MSSSLASVDRPKQSAWCVVRHRSYAAPAAADHGRPGVRVASRYSSAKARMRSSRAREPAMRAQHLARRIDQRKAAEDPLAWPVTQPRRGRCDQQAQVRRRLVVECAGPAAAAGRTRAGRPRCRHASVTSSTSTGTPALRAASSPRSASFAASAMPMRGSAPELGQRRRCRDAAEDDGDVTTHAHGDPLVGERVAEHTDDVVAEVHERVARELRAVAPARLASSTGTAWRSRCGDDLGAGAGGPRDDRPIAMRPAAAPCPGQASSGAVPARVLAEACVSRRARARTAGDLCASKRTGLLRRARTGSIAASSSSAKTTWRGSWLRSNPTSSGTATPRSTSLWRRRPPGQQQRIERSRQRRPVGLAEPAERGHPAAAGDRRRPSDRCHGIGASDKASRTSSSEAPTSPPRVRKPSAACFIVVRGAPWNGQEEELAATSAPASAETPSPRVERATGGPRPGQGEAGRRGGHDASRQHERQQPAIRSARAARRSPVAHRAPVRWPRR